MVALESEISVAKSVLLENIDRLIERGEKIDLLVEKTESLQEETFQMKGKSKKLRVKMWWRNLKIWCCVCIILGVILFIVIWAACGFPNFQDCRAKVAETVTKVEHTFYHPPPTTSQPND
eukprot:TRINITY_DN2861_c0_g1_i2.p1 TRINITY_DN2861_c0_g1~~TRINITY_DN2861_c0_g1_i2.p1  ORF type:complete len:120 (+),score=23.26 TRINITY_DN2861_c0_g1_i2:281-640(+)